jgi:histidinol phosphatase-like enzyme (inositol monophosphatase family)
VEAADAHELDEAVAMTRLAGDRSLDWFRSPSLGVEHKGDGTPVTVADRSVERALREAIAERWPHDAVEGEEEDPTPGTSGRRWIIDPIDGTKAFTHGVPLYSTLVALEDERGHALGIIHLPALGRTVWAGRGLGCFEDGEPVGVADRSHLRGAYVSTSGFSSWSPSAFQAVQSAGALLRTWGDGFGYALVATGRLDAMVDPLVALWDVAPMPVILAEAGGRFTDLTGVARADGGSGAASAGTIHDELLALFA